MTQYLPPNLLALFAPRDPIAYIPPLDKLPHEKKLTPYRGVAACLQEFEDPKDTPPPTRVETKDERKERKRRERAEQVAYKLEQDLALWDPVNDTTITGDPYKSLFVARINYDTSESKLRREFEAYGPVKQIRVAHSTTSRKPRGYAFIEFEHERDMHSAYKHADGKKIDGRRVLVDIERGRTIKGWRPRRLGGGLGGTRKGGPDVNTKYSGREENSSINRDDERGGRSRSREREREREREKEREPRRRRSRSRERRRRSRSRDRRRRSRSRDRSRKASRDRGEAPAPEETMEVEKERDRKRRRSRSRERDRGDRGDRADRADRGDRADRVERPRRSRSRDRKRRRSRSKDRRRSRDRGAGEEQQEFQEFPEGYDPNMVIKQEQNGDDEDYGQYSSIIPDDEGFKRENYQGYEDSQDSRDPYSEYSNNGDSQQGYNQPQEEGEQYTE